VLPSRVGARLGEAPPRRVSGDLLAQELADAADEQIEVERLGDHLARRVATHRVARQLGIRGHEQHGDPGEGRVIPHDVVDVDPARARHLDVQQEQPRARADDGIDHERAVRDDDRVGHAGGAEGFHEDVGDVLVVLGDHDRRTPGVRGHSGILFA
jgi:hypothetical protein